MTRIATLFLAIFAAFPLLAAELILVKDGKPATSIVLPTDLDPVLTFAAEELSLFLGKISGGEKVSIASSPVDGLLPIYFLLSKDERLHEDGFIITANASSLRIEGKTSNGVLYGAYEILKRYGGIRWLFPGKDGEYFTVRPSISMPYGSTFKNPDFTYRDIVKVCMRWSSPIWDTWDWAVRNNMRFTSTSIHPSFKDGLAKYGPISKIGGHCFSPLLNSSGLTDENGVKLYGKAFDAHVEKMFAEHPDYYPMIKGKRVISRHGGVQPQPCTTHPEVISIVAKNVLRTYEQSRHPVMLVFGNNDTTQWCECEKCQAIDPPEEKEAGHLSTRYWTFANAVADIIFQAKPDLIFNGWTYQNFSVPPKGVKPNQHIGLVMISNHRRCWKHDLDDENCPTNQWYYQYQKDWNDYNVPLYTYEMLSRAGNCFIPVEKSWVDTLRFYKKSLPNFTGMKTEISCPDGSYGPAWNTFSVLNNWRMMWQAMYLGLTFQWDVNSDYNKVHEEINALYYGKGWDGGVRDFRTLLTELYMNAPGCWGYGHSTPVGKFLEVPGAKEKLYGYLASAEKAAAADPDPRALAHVKLEKEFFEKTWVAANEDYVSNYREIKIYPLMDKITIDGKLDELDWKNAEITTRFRPFDGLKAKPVRHQTGLKLAYDQDNLYVAFECLEPRPNELKTDITEHDGPVWEDNDIELFINDPMMGGNYIQLLINAAGVVCDGTVAAGQAGRGMSRAFDALAEVKTSFAADRYFVEMRIPSKSITGTRFSPGLVLKINSLRARRVMRDGVEEKSETEFSTITGGSPHGVDSFMPVTFATPRTVSAGSRAEIDTRVLRNGSFNEISTETAKFPKHWTVKDGKYPRHWSLSSSTQYGGDLELLPQEDSADNHFLRLRKGFVFQEHKAKNENLRMSLRVRGKGTLAINMLRYAAGWKKSLPTSSIKKLTIDSEQWQHEVFDFKRPSEDSSEVHCIMLWPMQNSEIDIDDVIIMGIE